MLTIKSISAATNSVSTHPESCIYINVQEAMSNSVLKAPIALRRFTLKSPAESVQMRYAHSATTPIVKT